MTIIYYYAPDLTAHLFPECGDEEVLRHFDRCLDNPAKENKIRMNNTAKKNKIRMNNPAKENKIRINNTAKKKKNKNE